MANLPVTLLLGEERDYTVQFWPLSRESRRFVMEVKVVRLGFLDLFHHSVDILASLLANILSGLLAPSRLFVRAV